MYVVVGRTRCANCEELVERERVLAGEVICCDYNKCAAHGRHLHTDCTFLTDCENCHRTMPPAVLPYQHVPDHWEDVELADTPRDLDTWKAQLRTFLTAPTPAGEWFYLGYRRGGHELSWAGELRGVFGVLETVQVFFHVHFTDRFSSRAEKWGYGGAWIEGVIGSGIELEEEPLVLRQGLSVVVAAFLDRLREAEKLRLSSAASSGSWRKEDK
ncbi:MAG TPA: hypothetical protein VGD67_13200 [Pseudonocardiaceae bacterium]